VIIQKGTMLALTIVMLFSGIAAAATIKFKGGGVAETKITHWKKKNIKVINDANKVRIYYYAEIESIDGRTIKSLKIYIVFMKLWSNVRDWMKNPLMGFQERKQMYDKDGKIIKKRKEFCKNFKREKTIKIYDERGIMRIEVTCFRGRTTYMRKFFRNGVVKSILTFRKPNFPNNPPIIPVASSALDA